MYMNEKLQKFDPMDGALENGKPINIDTENKQTKINPEEIKDFKETMFVSEDGKSNSKDLIVSVEEKAEKQKQNEIKIDNTIQQLHKAYEGNNSGIVSETTPEMEVPLPPKFNPMDGATEDGNPIIKEKFNPLEDGIIDGKPIEKIETKSEDKREEQEEIKKFERNFKSVLGNIGSQSKTMLDALYERQQERLTPLQSNENFQAMANGIKNLQNFEGKIDADTISKITEDINKISRLFDDIKVQPNGGQIKENTQNLEKLAFGARSFSSSLEDSKSAIPLEMTDKAMEEKSFELRKSMQRLAEQSQKMWLMASKLKSN